MFKTLASVASAALLLGAAQAHAMATYEAISTAEIGFEVSDGTPGHSGCLTLLFDSAAFGNATKMASTDAGCMSDATSASADHESSVSGDASPDFGLSFGEVETEGTLTLVNDTSIDPVSVLVGYDLFVDTDASIMDPATEDAVAVAEVYFSLSIDDFLVFDLFFSSETDPINMIATGPDGVLDSISIDLSPGEELKVEFGTFAEGFAIATATAVPLPGAVVLMIAGLAGLGVVGFRRRA